MKLLFVYVLFLNTLLSSQPSEDADSTSYYNSLSYSHVQNNNYKEALSNTQKAIQYAKKTTTLKIRQLRTTT